MEQPNNPNAFPSKDLQTVHFHGMTLRDYFASAAMQGMVTKYGKPDDYNWQYGVEDTHDVLAKKCYKIADAMLKQREL